MRFNLLDYIPTNYINRLIYTSATMFINMFSEKILSLGIGMESNDNLIQYIECSNNKNKIVLCTIRLKNIEQDVMLNTITIKSMVFEGTTIELPWKALLTEVTNVIIPEVTIECMIMPSQKSLFMTVSSMDQMSDSMYIESSNDLIELINEVKRIINDNLSLFSVTVIRTKIIISESLCAIIDDLSFDSNRIRLKRMVLTDGKNTCELTGFVRIASVISIEKVIIQPQIIDSFPQIFIDDSDYQSTDFDMKIGNILMDDIDITNIIVTKLNETKVTATIKTPLFSVNGPIFLYDDDVHSISLLQPITIDFNAFDSFMIYFTDLSDRLGSKIISEDSSVFYINNIHIQTHHIHDISLLIKSISIGKSIVLRLLKGYISNAVFDIEQVDVCDKTTLINGSIKTDDFMVTVSNAFSSNHLNEKRFDFNGLTISGLKSLNDFVKPFMDGSTPQSAMTITVTDCRLKEIIHGTSGSIGLSMSINGMIQMANNMIDITKASIMIDNHVVLSTEDLHINGNAATCKGIYVFVDHQMINKIITIIPQNKYCSPGSFVGDINAFRNIITRNAYVTNSRHDNAMIRIMNETIIIMSNVVVDVSIDLVSIKIYDKLSCVSSSFLDVIIKGIRYQQRATQLEKQSIGAMITIKEPGLERSNHRTSHLVVFDTLTMVNQKTQKMEWKYFAKIKQINTFEISFCGETCRIRMPIEPINILLNIDEELLLKILLFVKSIEFAESPKTFIEYAELSQLNMTVNYCPMISKQNGFSDYVFLHNITIVSEAKTLTNIDGYEKLVDLLVDMMVRSYGSPYRVVTKIKIVEPCIKPINRFVDIIVSFMDHIDHKKKSKAIYKVLTTGSDISSYAVSRGIEYVCQVFH